MRRLLVIGLVVLAVFMFMRLFNRRVSPDVANATLELVRTEGMARAGYTGEAPLAYADATRGLTGEAPEIARVILQKMGVNRIEGVLTQSSELISELYARRFEFIASGMTITPERCRKLLFSAPTYAVGESFLVRKGNPLGLHSYEDAVKNSSAHLGVVTGSLQHDYATTARVPAGRIRLLSAPGAGVASLLSGVIDAFASDALTVQQIVDQSPHEDIERALPFTGPMLNGHEVKHYGAFAFRMEDRGLAREFNTLLKKFIGTPEHLALVRPFGITAADIPPQGANTKTLCRYGYPGPPQQLATAH